MDSIIEKLSLLLFEHGKKLLSIPLVWAIYVYYKKGCLEYNRKANDCGIGAIEGGAKQNGRQRLNEYRKNYISPVYTIKGSNNKKRCDLLTVIEKEAINNNEASGTVVWIYAHSGMGKTALLLNLYWRYIRRIFLWPWVNLDDIVYLTWQRFDEMEKRVAAICSRGLASRTILFLDGYDEYYFANNRYEEVEKFTSMLYGANFKTVLITCRAQVFDDRINVPTGVRSIYLEKLDIEGVLKFLRKKYCPYYFPFHLTQWLQFRSFILRIHQRDSVERGVIELIQIPFLLHFIDVIIEKLQSSTKAGNVQETVYYNECISWIIETWIKRETKKYIVSNQNTTTMINNMADKAMFYLRLKFFILLLSNYFFMNRSNIKDNLVELGQILEWMQNSEKANQQTIKKYYQKTIEIISLKCIIEIGRDNFGNNWFGSFDEKYAAQKIRRIVRIRFGKEGLSLGKSWFDLLNKISIRDRSLLCRYEPSPNKFKYGFSHQIFHEYMLAEWASLDMDFDKQLSPYLHDYSSAEKFYSEMFLNNKILPIIKEYPKAIQYRMSSNHEFSSFPQNNSRYINIWTDIMQNVTEIKIVGEADLSEEFLRGFKKLTKVYLDRAGFLTRDELEKMWAGSGNIMLANQYWVEHINYIMDIATKAGPVTSVDEGRIPHRIWYDASWLKQFSLINAIDLSDNRIDTIDWITNAKFINSLRELRLRNNRLKTVKALLQLNQLKFVDILGNAGLEQDETLMVAGELEAQGCIVYHDWIKIVFEDRVFESTIRSYINKPKGDVLAVDLQKIEKIDFSNKSIRNINGIQFAINLKSLQLTNNKIVDIHVLRGLTQLRELNLGGNKISDINALQGLAQLSYLNIMENPISDISVVKKLPILFEFFSDIGGWG